MATIDCVTCHRPLSEGREHPAYFAAESVGYSPSDEAERAAGDVSAILRYADTVNGAIWDMLMVAEKRHPELPEPEHYFDEARSLCLRLIDLVDETLGSFVTTSWEKYKKVFMNMREQDPFLGEYFQWLAERIDERLRNNPRKPCYKT